jgi:hypothetical protein
VPGLGQIRAPEVAAGEPAAVGAGAVQIGFGEITAVERDPVPLPPASIASANRSPTMASAGFDGSPASSVTGR